MANNVLTALAPILYSAARITPRELTGIIGACTRNFNDKGVALGDTVTVPVAPVLTSGSVTPAQTFTAGNGLTAGSRILTLNNYKQVSWNYNAEEERSLMNGGNQQEMFKQTVEQGIRTLANEVEAHLWAKARVSASRAFGTPGTAPFGSDLSAANQMKKILTDNGAQVQDRHLILNSDAILNISNLSQLQKVNEAGTDENLRMGVLGDLSGFGVHESAAPVSVTAGTGTLYTTDAAGYAVGATSITLITGSGTILAGDVVTFAGDTNKYVVKTGIAAPGAIVLQEPGLKVAIAASATAVTVGAAATANIAMHRSGLIAVIRPALQPNSPIAEQMTVTDPQTGLSFLMLRSVGDSMTSYYMRIVYDSFAPNGYAIAQLLG